MKKILFVVLLLVLGVVGFYWYRFSNAKTTDGGTKQQALTLKKHSDIFNLSVEDAMNAYFDMKEAFVNADTAKAKESCRRFIQLFDSIPMAELKKDTLNLYDAAMTEHANVKSNAVSLLQQTDITEMRKDFKSISDNLYPSFFGMINYEGEKMYLQNCPMAFGEDKEANWISKTVEVVNPYLGKNHPEFKATMLHCGSVKDTIKAK
ncbi:MAG: DUF3347 domain-containing protein [Chitinophagaceae bacterium]|nr:DUF3347 domain-containing protein [Chitinophagaceae bacterium]